MSSSKGRSVALISQRRDYTDIITRQANDRGIQFGKVIDYGKDDDLNEVELLESLSNNPDIRVITAYIESVTDSSRLFKLLPEVTKTKPVIIWKGELTSSISGADLSSTGAVEEKRRPQHSECQFCRDNRCRNKASMFYNEVREPDAQVCSVFRRHDVEPEKELNWDSVFRRSRTIKVNSADELVDAALAFLLLGPHRGLRVAVVGNDKEATLATANASERTGLAVPPFPIELREKLASIIPIASVRNPVDVGSLLSSPAILKTVLEMVLTEDSIDTVIINTPQASLNSEFSRVVVDARKSLGKPIVIVLPAGSTGAGAAKLETARRNTRDYYLGEGIPVFPTPARAAKALINLAHYAEHRNT